MKELKKLETEKVVNVERVDRFLNRGFSNVVYKPIDIGDRYYSGL